MAELASTRSSSFPSTQSRNNKNWQRVLSALSCVAFVFAIASASSAQTVFFNTVASLNGTNGADPLSGLVPDGTGSFYGGANLGGDSRNCDGGGCGTVFGVTAAGNVTRLHSFDYSDGEYPAIWVRASDGNLYGVTARGGTYDEGTIFKITPSGALTILHEFNGDDGACPMNLLQATDGNFYGVTCGGGTQGGYGTFFTMSPDGTVTTLHSFDGSDGQGAETVMQASDGNFYGSAAGGGNGHGTIFKIDTTGTLTLLHIFSGPDGFAPTGPIIEGGDGYLYGTTDYGGESSCQSIGCGTVFRISKIGAFTMLYGFTGPDGEYPIGGVIQDSHGNLYGTTYAGGAYGGCYDRCGTVFQLTLGGTLTTLHNFAGPDGGSPGGWLLQVADGTFYGTTSYGGAYDSGTVFRMGFVHGCASCR
jgi:uncharacterized repeat protein (TIGR03803 family)